MFNCNYCGKEFENPVSSGHTRKCSEYLARNPVENRQPPDCLCGHKANSLTAMKLHRSSCDTWKNRDKKKVLIERSAASLQKKYGPEITNSAHVLQRRRIQDKKNNEPSKIETIEVENTSMPQGAPIGAARNPILHNLEFIDFNIQEVTITHIHEIEVARNFLELYHYAGFGRGSVVIYGIFLHTELIGLVKFAPPVRQGVANTLGIKTDQLLELDRFCIHPARHKKNLASFIMSRVIKCVKLDYPKIIKLVSFADPRAGHIGNIYKASNWVYDGLTRSSYYYIDNDGKEVNKKTLYSYAKKHNMKEYECYKSLGYKKMKTPPKRKYHYDLNHKE